MRFSCPFCNFTVSADDSHSGERLTCGACGKTILAPSGRFEDGCIVGDFVIKSKLGAGSIGAVYKARQISLDRIVALKILSPQYTTKKGTSDFLREARAAAKITHTNLVQSFAVGEEGGICYMAMTYVRGETLRSRLKREKTIPIDESLHIIQQVAEALHCAWTEAGLIHRDVKPDNIMLSESGVVKLTDLGLAINQSEWSEDMEISGSPAYMSPEQFAGEKLDTRSDIYSLGITLYQMLSGKLPFDGATVKTLARQHYEDDPVPLNKINPLVPSRVVYLVKKMTAKSENRRFRNMEALLKEIWTIRQTTAPTRDLIPEVHTISMKRLQYNAHEASRNHERKQREKLEHEKRREMLVRIVAIVFGTFIFAIAIVGIYYSGSTKSNQSAILQDIELFAKRAEESRLSSETLGYQAQKLIPMIENAHETDKANALRFAREYVDYIVLKRLESELAVLLEEKDVKISELQSEVRKMRLAALEYEKTVEENKRNQNELLRLNKEALELKQQIFSEKEKHVLTAKNMESLSTKFAELNSSSLEKAVMITIMQLAFADAAEIITRANASGLPLNAEALARLEKMTILCSKIYEAITSSRIKYAGRELVDSGGVIVSIENGTLTCSDSLSAKTVPWNRLTYNDLLGIIGADNIPEFADKTAVKVAYEILRSNFGKAYELDKKNPIIPQLGNLYFESEFRKIRALVMTNRKAVPGATQQLLLKLSGLPDYQTYRTKLEFYIK